MMEESKTNSEQTGNVKISEEVVAIVAGVAASEINGVAGMANSIAGGFYELLGKKNFTKGVKVAIEGESTTIDIFIIVEYGSKIPEVAWEIQEKVKNQVETMTGLTVSNVNIHIQGVNIKNETIKADDAAQGKEDSASAEE